MLDYEIYQKILDEKNIRNADVSRATGISNMTLSDWKRGKSRPKADKMRKIANFLDVPIWIFEENINNEEKKLSDMIMSDNERELIELFRLVPEKDQGMLIDMVAAVLKSRGLYPTLP